MPSWRLLQKEWHRSLITHHHGAHDVLIHMHVRDVNKAITVEFIRQELWTEQAPGLARFSNSSSVKLVFQITQRT